MKKLLGLLTLSLMFGYTFAGSFTTPEYSNKPYHSYEGYWSNHMFYTQGSEVITFVKVPITTTKRTVTNIVEDVCSMDIDKERIVNMIQTLESYSNSCESGEFLIRKMESLSSYIRSSMFTTKRYSSSYDKDTQLKVIEFAIVIPIKEITNTVYVDRIVERVKWMSFPNALPNTGGFISNE